MPFGAFARRPLPVVQTKAGENGGCSLPPVGSSCARGRPWFNGNTTDFGHPFREGALPATDQQGWMNHALGALIQQAPKPRGKPRYIGDRHPHRTVAETRYGVPFVQHGKPGASRQHPRCTDDGAGRVRPRPPRRFSNGIGPCISNWVHRSVRGHHVFTPVPVRQGTVHRNRRGSVLFSRAQHRFVGPRSPLGHARTLPGTARGRAGDVNEVFHAVQPRGPRKGGVEQITVDGVHVVAERRAMNQGTNRSIGTCKHGSANESTSAGQKGPRGRGQSGHSS